MYIKREEAIVTLYDLINSSVLAEDICNDLTEIAGCIANEELGLDTWGADDTTPYPQNTAAPIGGWWGWNVDANPKITVKQKTKTKQSKNTSKTKKRPPKAEALSSENRLIYYLYQD